MIEQTPEDIDDMIEEMIQAQITTNGAYEDKSDSKKRILFSKKDGHVLMYIKKQEPGINYIINFEEKKEGAGQCTVRIYDPRAFVYDPINDKKDPKEIYAVCFSNNGQKNAKAEAAGHVKSILSYQRLDEFIRRCER